MKKNIILSVNPDEACILAENNIIREKVSCELVTAINVNKLLNHIHPDQKFLDSIYELIDGKYNKFIKPHINLQPPKIDVNKIQSVVIPKLPHRVEDVRKYKINGINIGLAALSTAASFSKCTSEKTEDYGDYIVKAWELSHKSYVLGMLLRDYDFDEVYIFNGRHAISRPLVEAIGIHRNVKINYYEMDYKRTKFNINSDGYHNISKIASEIAKADIISEHGDEYFSILRNGEINSEYKKIQKSFEYDKKLEIRTHQRLVVFFTSSIDEFFAIKDEACINTEYKTQCDLAIYLAERQTKLNFRLIIRLHPYLKYKHDSWKDEWKFEELISKKVIIISPNDPLCSYKLLDNAACCVTIGSSIGMEAIRYGIPCVEVGETIANNMGITVNGNLRKELDEFLEHPWINLDAKKMNAKYGAYQLAPPYYNILDEKGNEMKIDEIINKVSPSKRTIKYLKRIVKETKILNQLYTYAYYYYIRRKCQNIINRVDEKMPLKGRLEFGYAFFEPNEEIFNPNLCEKLIPNKSLELDAEEARMLNNVFDALMPMCLEYLGDQVIIDSICVTEIKKDDYKSVSANWHTDNVGHNLKIYLCIDGDGSIVTKYIPGTNLKSYKASRIEDLRMIGLKNRRSRSNEIDIIHKTGTIAVFDTNGKHRGGYIDTESHRIVLEIELANKDKAEELKNIAPIGVRSGQNTCYISNNFLNEFNYSEYLDRKRLSLFSHDWYIYGGAPTHYVIN